jgi:hypothetical protein
MKYNKGTIVYHNNFKRHGLVYEKADEYFVKIQISIHDEKYPGRMTRWDLTNLTKVTEITDDVPRDLVEAYLNAIKEQSEIEDRNKAKSVIDKLIKALSDG